MSARSHQITEPLRPATIVQQQARQDSNPDRRGWSSPCSRLHHRPVKRTTRIERVSPEWRSGALPSELRPRRSLRQESNPHLGRTKGVCLPLTLRRRNGDGGSRTRSSSLQARRPSTRASSPGRCGRMDLNHHSARRRVYSARSSPMLSVRREGGRPDSNRYRRGSRPRVLAVTPRPPRACSGDDRTRTGGLSPDKRALCSSELHPQVAPVGFEPTVSSS
jgi:hypothetical protein